MKRILLTTLASLFFLASCSTPAKLSEKNIQDSTSSEESRHLELLDQELHETTEKDWELIYLSKDDYDRLLNDLSKPDEDGVQPIADIRTHNEEISVILNNRDGESLENLFTAPFFDTLIRRMYINSAYYQSQQPLIKIMDLDGTILAENKDVMDSSGINIE